MPELSSGAKLRPDGLNGEFRAMSTAEFNSRDKARSQILKKAREISQLLVETDELQRFHEAERDYLDDPWIQETLKRQREAQVALSLQPGDTEDALRSELEEQVQYYSGALARNPRYARYQAARARVNKFLTAVMTIVSRPVTGEGATKGGCSGGCGSGSCSIE